MRFYAVSGVAELLASLDVLQRGILSGLKEETAPKSVFTAQKTWFAQFRRRPPGGLPDMGTAQRHPVSGKSPQTSMLGSLRSSFIRSLTA